MVVRQRMTPQPVTVSPHDTLAAAQEKMTAGRFRRLPVAHGGPRAALFPGRPPRRRGGPDARAGGGAAMTGTPLTFPPATTVEDAVRLMLKHQISGLPVVENGKVV